MINITDLYKKKKERDRTREKVYEKVLTKCHNKITYSANKYIDQEYTFYTVPDFIVGFPLFNKDECSKFIIKRLLENGFFIKYVGSGLIFICWKIQKKTKVPKKITFNLNKNQHISPSIPLPKRKISKSKDTFRSTSDIPDTNKYFL